MNITLDERLKEYVLENEIKRIVINNYHTKVCCAAAVLPVVSFKDPDPSRGYYIYHLEEGLEVYVEETLEFKDNTFVIKCRDYKLFKDFEVEGVKLL